MTLSCTGHGQIDPVGRGNPGMPVSAKTGRFPLKIGSKREEKEGKSWKILQFSDVWPAKFSTKFDGDVL